MGKQVPCHHFGGLPGPCVAGHEVDNPGGVVHANEVRLDPLQRQHGQNRRDSDARGKCGRGRDDPRNALGRAPAGGVGHVPA